MICQVCNKEFASLGGLHNHLGKTHKIDQADYYHTFYPRYDKNNNELINYKDYKHYHKSDFNNRESFASWLSANCSDPIVKDYCFQKAEERMVEKLTTKLPSQVELKSIYLPSISGFEKICGGKDKFIEEAKRHNFELKFDYTLEPIIDLSEPLKIFQDTREQRPLFFSCPIDTMKLSAGDYTCAAPYYSDVFVERKSAADLAGTLGKGRERFEEEILRAKELGFYVVVVIESSYADILHYSSNGAFVKKINGQHILHEIREIMTKHDHIQFVTAGNRRRAASLIETIFRMKNQVTLLDLEYLKDIGKI